VWSPFFFSVGAPLTVPQRVQQLSLDTTTSDSAEVVDYLDDLQAKVHAQSQQREQVWHQYTCTHLVRRNQANSKQAGGRVGRQQGRK
jgi:hypothetical protein